VSQIPTWPKAQDSHPLLTRLVTWPLAKPGPTDKQGLFKLENITDLFCICLWIPIVGKVKIYFSTNENLLDGVKENTEEHSLKNVCAYKLHSSQPCCVHHAFFLRLSKWNQDMHSDQNYTAPLLSTPSPVDGKTTKPQRHMPTRHCCVLLSKLNFQASEYKPYTVTCNK
jgi:hypothetical protein